MIHHDPAHWHPAPASEVQEARRIGAILGGLDLVADLWAQRDAVVPAPRRHPQPRRVTALRRRAG